MTTSTVLYGPGHGQGRHTMWTGDLGMACVPWDCIGGRPGFPTLDSF